MNLFEKMTINRFFCGESRRVAFKWSRRTNYEASLEKWKKSWKVGAERVFLFLGGLVIDGCSFKARSSVQWIGRKWSEMNSINPGRNTPKSETIAPKLEEQGYTITEEMLI
jgi:hypothetical protein